MGAGNRPRAGIRHRGQAPGLRALTAVLGDQMANLEAMPSNVGIAKLDESNARRCWLSPPRPACPPWRAKSQRGVLGEEEPRRENSAETETLLFSFSKLGWTGWTGWTGTEENEASRVQPRRLYLDGVDRRTSQQRLQGSKVSPCPSSLQCQRATTPRHHRARLPTLKPSCVINRPQVVGIC
jgi:hypothetical protein